MHTISKKLAKREKRARFPHERARKIFWSRFGVYRRLYRSNKLSKVKLRESSDVNKATTLKAKAKAKAKAAYLKAKNTTTFPKH